MNSLEGSVSHLIGKAESKARELGCKNSKRRFFNTPGTMAMPEQKIARTTSQLSREMCIVKRAKRKKMHVGGHAAMATG
jgi:hypothetical protein